MDLSCSICSYQFKTPALLEKHRRGALKTCVICMKKLCSRVSLESHSRHCLSPETRRCNKCRRYFENFDTLLFHTEEKNCWDPRLNRRCERRAFVYADDAAYSEHLSWCVPPAPVVGSGCLFCSRRFASSLEMLDHLRWHMPSLFLKCEKCPAYFMKEEELAEHARLHSRQKREREVKEEQERLIKRVKLEQRSMDEVSTEPDSEEYESVRLFGATFTVKVTRK